MQNSRFRDKSLTLRDRISDLLSQLTIEEKIGMLSSHHKPVERLGIREWHVGCEAARGFVSREEGQISTVFPQPIGMAASFDKALMRKIGEIAGDETRYYYQQNPVGKLMLWGPTVDMERSPLWGRNEEAYGEDTCLAGEMSREYTIGLAGCSRADEPQDRNILDCRTDEPGVLLKTVPTLKHFCANNNEKDRISGNSNVTERLLNEYYYRAFMPALCEGGAHSVMAAYNKIGGIPGDMNPDIQKVLKDKWGMDFTVTDGGAFSQNVLEHRFTQTHAQTLAMCIKNGMDTMTDNADMVESAARAALAEGLINEADIDKAVGNVLLGRFRLGEFDDDHKYSDMNVTPDSEYARSVNLKASLEQVCLLKNNGILPLDKNTEETVLIAGPIADENYRDWYTGTASYAVSIRKAFEDRKKNVIFDNGWDIVALRSKSNGKYLSVSEDGTARFISDNITTSEQFELHNWDDNTYNLKSLTNGKYITEDGAYKAVSETPYSWFIREWLKPRRCGDYYCFESWHDDSVYMDECGMMRTKPTCRPDDSRLFEIITISKGAERIRKYSESCGKVIFCGGNHPMQIARECYDRATLALPPHQKNIIMKTPAEKLIFILISGYPYAITEETGHASAVVHSSHCGAELGNVIFSTIYGENNPAARCPLTWYSSDTEIPAITEYDIISSKSTYMYYDGKPLFPFGYGLSYSDFKYSNFTVKADESSINACVTITNTSTVDGDEVVQFYFTEESCRRGKPNIKLCGFERVHISSGNSVCVNIKIPMERISHYDSCAEEMTVISGNYCFFAGASCKDLRCKSDIFISGNDYSVRKCDAVYMCRSFDDCSGGQLDFSIDNNDRYVRFGDWGGSVTYDHCSIAECTSVSVWAAAPCAPAEIEIISDGIVLGSAKIKPASARDDFTEYRIPISPAGRSESISFRMKGLSSVFKYRFNK